MERSVVEQAIRLAGLDVPADTDFEVVGDEPVLASPHRLATGAATARILTGVGANALWRVRTGRTQRLVVDARHAAAALVSAFLLKLEDAPADLPLRAGRDLRLLRISETADGRFVQLHPSFRDAPAVLGLLGLPEEAEVAQIDAAVAGWKADELEAAFVAGRLCGGIVHSSQEWAAHPQGRAVAGLPVVSIRRIGDAPPERLPPGERPAAGVRVADLTRVLAGPTVGKVFAEHGADVLHVSAPGLEDDGIFSLDTGIGKRQAFVDLDAAGGPERLLGLLADCDVFVQGYRLGRLAERGLGPEEMAARRPGIVYVSENCYGHVGPWAARPGWEQLAQAATGMSWREGKAHPDGRPRLAPAAVSDYSTGFLAAFAAMTALARRATEGGSWLVEASLCQTASWYQRLGDDNDLERADPGDVSRFLGRMETADFGPIRYLLPALEMSETPPRFTRPPARHGTHEVAWEPRPDR